MSSSLIKRILSALVLAPLFLYTLYVGDEPLFIWLLIAFLISVYEWYNLSRKTEFYIPTIVLGFIYMTLSYSSFYALREVYSIMVLLLFLGMIWMSDIGAYVIGKIIGGPKLIQKISPNKTWSGFAGAVILPAIFAILWGAGFGFHAEFDHNPWYILLPILGGIGLVMGCVGQAGDLLVSFIKRKANVKDTGHIIPGHGGLLDRIDSMLLGAPVFLIVITLLSYVF